MARNAFDDILLDMMHRMTHVVELTRERDDLRRRLARAEKLLKGYRDHEIAMHENGGGSCSLYSSAYRTGDNRCEHCIQVDRFLTESHS